MSRYRHTSKQDRMTKFEKFQWVVACIVFSVVFICYFIFRFFSNCIFEWPLRFDVKTCWNEQIQPAKEKAAEKAVNFIP